MAGLPSMTATEEMVMGAAVRATQGASRADTACSGAGFWTLHAATVVLFALIAVLISATALVAPYFLSARKFASKAGQIAPLAITSLGQMATILLGGIDLSVGSSTSLVTGVASNLLTANSYPQPALGILACLGIGAGIGALNGTLIFALRIPDLFATLATFSIVQGTALIVRPAPGRHAGPRGHGHDPATRLGYPAGVRHGAGAVLDERGTAGPGQDRRAALCYGCQSRGQRRLSATASGASTLPPICFPASRQRWPG